MFRLRRLGRFIHCKEASRLISQAQDRPLPLRDRIRLRLHIHWCLACQRYERQVVFLRRALRRYRE